MSSADLIADREFEKTEFYCDHMRHVGVFYVLGSLFPVEAGDMAVLGIHHSRAEGAFGDADKRAAADLLPHLRRSLQIRRRLSTAQLERGSAFDALASALDAIIVVDPLGRLVYANRQAESLLGASRGLSTRSGHLVTGHRATSVRLYALIRDAAGSGPGGALTIERAERLPLVALVAPFRHSATSSPAAIVFIRDPERRTVVSAHLSELFGLTPSEARIAAMVAEGKSVGEAARAAGVSIHTARTHLKRVLDKTGTKRQAQLVALLLGSVAARAPT